ncbi:thiamine pyrophosphate-dependent enzyme [Stigmatella sp. ncwal1]|uniref:2-oxoisovalerate dehydrogenase subunit alpha n=1 Tax=Stigmatella ashevillensis TaxID=2995309 RepID=A0ABT5D3F4_9BACT|nr:thiamine pyrophosphate-dependent enzyme [Stigmatella ashevillena]MDC0708207.1 thiamine pyrophosphate-dependent enzyme [Stigmatella ashevillena]
MATFEPTPLTQAPLLAVYRAMLQSRLMDERLVSLQRQGRIGFYGTGMGQEATCIASAFALRPTDWLFPGLRENAAMLLRGYPLVPYLAQLFGNSGDEAKGRQMPAHQFSRRVNQVSWSSCIGTQLPQAVGAAWAARRKGHDTVVLACLGDGATSTGDFHAAMNFAGVLQAPAVFLCQNNHWSISLHISQQTKSETLALKASAYGFPGVRVDGNDAEAVYAATSAAVARARAGAGPSFIEAVTYRVGPHSSSDDPTLYQDAQEVEAWRAKDPLERLRARLIERAAWDTARDEALRAELLSELNAALLEAEALPPVPPESLFDDVYAEEPWHLAEQRREFLRAPRGTTD